MCVCVCVVQIISCFCKEFTSTELYAVIDFSSDFPHCDDSPYTSIPLLFIDTTGCDLHELETGDSESKGNEGKYIYIHSSSCLSFKTKHSVLSKMWALKSFWILQ